jgi:hypothetical protein
MSFIAGLLKPGTVLRSACRPNQKKYGSEEMGEVVNLRTMRKKAAKRAAESRAAENRLAHGRSKAERERDAARSEKIRRELDSHRIDGGEDR